MNNTSPITAIDAALWQSMLAGGYRNLKRNMSVVDELNVFPVPDGDTGKNMTMTIEGGAAGTQEDFDSVGELMAKFSRASLFSARGNSGVILSQFIRGLAIGSEGLTCYTTENFAGAFECGMQYAYQAVSKPTEGTMLTLLREGNEFLQKKSFSDFQQLFDSLLKELSRSLQHTPELLAVLKEAGVVDSGGAGLVCIFEGMQAIMLGEEVDETDLPLADHFVSASSFNENSTLEYGYCTEFILQLMHAKTDIDAFSLIELTQKLESFGDSVVTVQDGSVIKAHVHTFAPEEVIGYVRRFGELVTIKIENMSVQHSENNVEPQKPRQKFGVVATATGKGITDFFIGVGVDVVIDGGRTNNPSAEDFIQSFQKINADHIVVLPNDSNVVLTAKQAAELYQDAQIHVLNTRSIAEGFSALSMMDLSVDTVEQLIEDMTSCLSGVTSGYVATANRTTTFSGVAITSGDYIGCEDDTIYAASPDPIQAAMGLFTNLPDMEEKQVVTAFYGKGVEEQEVLDLEDAFREEFPLVEIGFIQGDQDVYRYIFAIE